jgi:alpha-galactosidase
VEIPVTATKEGYTRNFQGKLPTSVAPLVAYTAGIENLTVEAFEKKSKKLVYQAVSMDPLCSAVLSLQEVRDMCDEIFAANGEYLADYR